MARRLKSMITAKSLRKPDANLLNATIGLEGAERSVWIPTMTNPFDPPSGLQRVYFASIVGSDGIVLARARV